MGIVFIYIYILYVYIHVCICKYILMIRFLKIVSISSILYAIMYMFVLSKDNLFIPVIDVLCLLKLSVQIILTCC